MTDRHSLRTTLAPEQPWAVTPEKVSEVVARLVAAASPLRLIAQRCAQACGYGSAAKGDLAAANDLDLLVVEPEVSSRYSETVRLHKALRGVLMPVDLIVTSQARYEERSQVPGTVEHSARTEGRVLHDGF
jgi:predicted nucleotidyltransferase